MNARILLPAACLLMAIAILVTGCICCSPGTSPTPSPVASPSGLPSGTAAPTAAPSPTPVPVISATLSGWGTDKDTYARNENATGWVYVRNTGDTTIDSMDFSLAIHRLNVPFIGEYTITYSYNMTGLDIRPGKEEKVQFVQQIPSQYSGISTAGDYTFDVTAFLAGKDVGHFSKAVRVV